MSKRYKLQSESLYMWCKESSMDNIYCYYGSIHSSKLNILFHSDMYYNYQLHLLLLNMILHSNNTLMSKLRNWFLHIEHNWQDNYYNFHQQHKNQNYNQYNIHFQRRMHKIYNLL